ncbi:MAG: hypothetical protein MUE85_13940 [Microscillaceae bacterium]|jgi:hypothetical protein|nr:hypothetical protein [Microscillaceae bacterium]
MEIIYEDEYNFRAYNELDQEIFHYRYEPSYKLAIQTWQNYVPDADIIAIYQKIAQFAFQNQQPIIGSITDILGIDGSFDGTNEWLMREYMPISVKYGFRFAATVQPLEFYAQLALEEALGMAHEVGFTTQYFESLDEAYQWVTEQLKNYLSIA